jgi:hypothetical protein
MELNQLFELIRSQNCVLWVGAGLSKYAGFPLGNQIAEFLNSQLGEHKLTPGSPIKDVASIYEKVFTRNVLIKTIRDEFFSSIPDSFKYHKLLSKIPHFKTIITTNFDFLFELAYEDRIIKIVAPADYIGISEKNPVLIKIHGDFNEPEQLVITDSDYAKFFNETAHSLLYNFILTKLSLSHVVFLGYSFGDLNTLTLFERINHDLGTKRKEWFLITPGQEDFQIEFFKTKNISCFNLTGEEFIERLEKHINQNIISDVRRGHDVSTISEYLRFRELSPTIEFGPNGQKLRELKTLANKAASVHFSFKTSSEAALHLKKLQIGKSFDRIDVSLEDLNDFRMEVNGIFMSQINSPVSLRISSKPIPAQLVVLHFNNETIENVKMKHYRGKNGVTFKLTYDNFNLKIDFKMPLEKNQVGSINISLDSSYKSLSHALQIAQFMLHSSEGKPFELVKDSSKMPLQFSPNKQIHDKFSNLLEHFNHLQTIESYYDIQFRNFTVTAGEMNQARRLASFILGDILPYEKINGTFNQSEVNLDLLKKINEENSVIRLEIRQPDPLKLYGMKLNLDYLVVEVYDTIVKNLSDYLEGNTNELSFESKSKKVKAQIHKLK